MISIITPFNPFNIYNGAHVRARVIIDRICSCYPTQVIYTGQDSPKGILNKDFINRKAHEAGFYIHVFESNRKLSGLKGIQGLDDVYFDDIESNVIEAVISAKSSVLLVNYVFLTKIFESISSNGHFLKILDTHDRLSREDVFVEGNLPISFFCTSEEEEARGLHRADVIISIQKEEEIYFKKIAYSIQEVLTIGHLPIGIPLERTESTKKFGDRFTCGIVASGHVFNVKSVISLLSEWKTQGIGKRFKLIIAGSICDKVPKELLSEDVHLLGKVPDLAEFYQQCDLILLPVDLGTGLKIKTVEALSMLKPILGTKEAFRGLPFTESLGVVSSSVECVTWLNQLSEEKTISVMKQLENASFSRYSVYSKEVEKGYTRLNELINANIDSPCPGRPMSIRHVVNFADVPITSDLFLAQPRAAQAMIDAKKYFQVFQKDECSIDLVCKWDQCEFSKGLPNYLDGFVIDTKVVTSHEFENLPKMRRLPTIASLLDLSNLNDDELVVYTNSDIVVQPYFYKFIYEKFSQSRLDSLVINRRTLNKTASVLASQVTASALLGKDHPGFDCFVIRGKILKSFFYDRTLVGVHLIGRVILWNIFAHTELVQVLQRPSLTYHFGDDNSSKDETQSDFTAHNFDSACKVLKNLNDRFGKNWITPLKEYVPAGVRMDYKPNIYKPAIEKPILFLHGMFRVGSTYLFNKIRKENSRTKVYYEPFHETLICLSKEKISGDLETAKMHHRITDAHTVWNEYFDLLQDEGGVGGYQLPFAYDDMTCSDGEINNRKSVYISLLIEKALAEKRQPILQFNRTWLMSEPNILAKKYLIKNYWIKRDPWSQFYSMWKSKNENGGFLRTLIIIFFLNYKKLPFLEVAGLHKLYEMIKADLGSHQHFNFILVEKFSKKIIPKISKDHFILIFSYLWLVSEYYMKLSGSKLIDMNRVGTDLVYRREIEADFCKNYIYVNLDDCKLETYKDVSPSLYDDFRKIFKIVQSSFLVSEQFMTPKSKISEVENIFESNSNMNCVKLERIGEFIYAINNGNIPIHYQHNEKSVNILLLPNSRRIVKRIN